MKYDFLTLSILCWIPGTLIFVLRKDLRRVIITMGLCSVPFAFTEWMFYPVYWEPDFLWDLADRIGFGIEDLIFVTGLGGLTSAIFPFCFAKKLLPRNGSQFRDYALRLSFLFGIVSMLVLMFFSIGIPMIYGAVVIMLSVSAAIMVKRKDLLFPSLAGGILTCAVYVIICLVFSMIFKDAFRNVWHIEKFSGVYIATIPLEEYLYALSAGVAGSLFYPFVFDRRFA